MFKRINIATVRPGGVALATGAEEHSYYPHKAKEAAAYSDSHPLDQIQYLKAKLILKPDRFTSVDCTASDRWHPDPT